MTDEVFSQEPADEAPRRPRQSLRAFWLVGFVLVLSCFAALAVLKTKGPSFEAQTVVQVRDGANAMSQITKHVLGREALIATAARHGITGGKAAALLQEAIGLHELTSVAGTTLGLAPQVSGVVISVRLPLADQAVRVANDLALQVLDLGQRGQLDANHDLLSFYRVEEERLWQEVAALRSELAITPVGPETGSDRRLMLLQDQYDLIRRHLAEEEVTARLAAHQRADDFILLQRASTAQAVRSDNLMILAGLAGAVLLSLALAFVAERRPWAGRAKAPAQDSHGLPNAADPQRLILGMPRFLVISALTVLALIGLSLVLR